MKNATPDVFEAAIDAYRNGSKMAEVLETFNLSHSQFELAFMRAEWPELVGSAEPTAENVIAFRDFYEVSWGRISILIDRPESQVRKLYKENQGVLSQGLRIGRGGRWYLSERELYTEGLQVTGTRISEARVKAEGRRPAAVNSAAEQKLIKRSPKELKALATELGVKKLATSKANVIKQILAITRGEGA